jgi:hypothetical protein
MRIKIAIAFASAAASAIAAGIFFVLAVVTPAAWLAFFILALIGLALSIVSMCWAAGIVWGRAQAEAHADRDNWQQAAQDWQQTAQNMAAVRPVLPMDIDALLADREQLVKNIGTLAADLLENDANLRRRMVGLAEHQQRLELELEQLRVEAAKVPELCDQLRTMAETAQRIVTRQGPPPAAPMPSPPSFVSAPDVYGRRRRPMRGAEPPSSIVSLLERDLTEAMERREVAKEPNLRSMLGRDRGDLQGHVNPEHQREHSSS